MEKHPERRVPGMEMVLGLYPDEIDVGASDHYDKNEYGVRPTIKLLYPECRIATVLKLISCMEEKRRVPRVHLIPPESPEEHANVAVFFLVPLSRKLAIELLSLAGGYIPPDDYFKIIVRGDAEIDTESASEFFDLYDQTGYFFVDIKSHTDVGEELLWTKRLTLFSKNRPQP